MLRPHPPPPPPSAGAGSRTTELPNGAHRPLAAPSSCEVVARRAPAPPAQPRPACDAQSTARRAALAAMLMHEDGRTVARGVAGGSTKSRTRTQQLLRNVHAVTTAQELVALEATLRGVVAFNEQRQAQHIEVLRLQSIERAEATLLLRSAEERSRKGIAREAAISFARFIAPHGCICIEAAQRARILAEYPPAVLTAAHAALTHAWVAREELNARVHVLLPRERVEREHLVSRAFLEELQWTRLRSALQHLRAEQASEIEAVIRLSDTRRGVEQMELAARSKVEEALMQSLTLLLTDAYVERRRTSYRDVPAHELRARLLLAEEFVSGLQELKLRERRALWMRETLVGRSRVLHEEGALRAELTSAESAVFQAIQLAALREWQQLYESAMAVRGAAVEIERGETFYRRDLAVAATAEREALFTQQQQHFWFVRRRDQARSDFYGTFLDGRIALQQLEQRERGAREGALQAALTQRAPEEQLAAMVAGECRARRVVEEECWRAAFAHAIESALLCTAFDAVRGASTIRAVELQARRAITATLDSMMAVLQGAGAATVAELELEEVVLRSALEDEWATEMERLKADLGTSREDLEEELAAATGAASSAGFDPTTTDAGARRALQRSEDRVRATAAGHEAQRRAQMQLEELTHREGVARRTLIYGRAAQPPASPASADASPQPPLALALDLHSERGARGMLYAFVLEGAETLRRWEAEWEACFERWDLAELAAVDAEGCARAEWERAERERRALVYDMRNQPLPRNVWLGALEGDENQIRSNVEFEAEIAAGALLNYFKFVAPGFFDAVPRIVYRNLDRDASPQFFKMEISLAERIGDEMLVVETADMPEARAALERERDHQVEMMRVELAEELTRLRIANLEHEIRATSAAVFARMRRRIEDEDVLALTHRLADDEEELRTREWLASRAAMLRLLESFEVKYLEIEGRITQRVLVEQGALWDGHRAGAEGVLREEEEARALLHQDKRDAWRRRRRHSGASPAPRGDRMAPAVASVQLHSVRLRFGASSAAPLLRRTDTRFVCHLGCLGTERHTQVELVARERERAAAAAAAPAVLVLFPASPAPPLRIAGGDSECGAPLEVVLRTPHPDWCSDRSCNALRVVIAMSADGGGDGGGERFHALTAVAEMFDVRRTGAPVISSSSSSSTAADTVAPTALGVLAATSQARHKDRHSGLGMLVSAAMGHTIANDSRDSAAAAAYGGGGGEVFAAGRWDGACSLSLATDTVATRDCVLAAVSEGARVAESIIATFLVLPF